MGQKIVSQEWSLYIVAFLHFTSFSAILSLIPFYNVLLDLSGHMYALTVSGYFLLQMLPTVCFRYMLNCMNKRYAFLIALFGLSFCHLFSFLTSDKTLYVFFRCFAGFFDFSHLLLQIYILEAPSIGDRYAVSTTLDLLNCISSFVGPFVAGIFSYSHVRWGLYLLPIPLTPRYFGVACDLLSFLYALCFLSDSLFSSAEKRKITSRFAGAQALERQGLSRSLLADSPNAESPTESVSFSGDLNYILIVAIVCEFCNKFVISVIITGSSYYGTLHHQFSSFAFCCLLAGGGLLGTGYVRYGIRWLVFKRGIIIPVIVAISGTAGVVGVLLSIFGNHLIFLIGNFILIGSYWAYDPITSLIISVESNENNQLKLQTIVQIVRIISSSIPPFFVGQLMETDPIVALWFNLIPCLLMVTVMIVCVYLPGGKMAGQIPWAAVMEHEAKMNILNGDNEYESEYLGDDGAASKTATKSGPFLRSAVPHQANDDDDRQDVEAGSLDSMSGPLIDRPTYESAAGEEIEI